MENLPQEIYDLIGRLLDPEDWNTLRIISKFISQAFTPLRFESITTSHSTKGVCNLEKISSNKLLCPLVKQIICSHSATRLYPFGEFDHWLERIWFPDEAPPVHDKNEGEVKPMSEKEWENIPWDDKRAMYNDYVSEHVNADTERRQLADDLLTRGRLDRVFSNFTNLTAFVQHPALYENSLRWRRLQFILCEDTFRDDYFGQNDDAEALYSFSVLSALGHSRKSLKRLQKLCISSCGPGFLTASRLWHLSVGKDHKMIRALREKKRGADRDERVASRVDKKTTEMLGEVPPKYENQLATIGRVLEQINDLGFSVREDDTLGALSSIAPSVADLLCHTKNVHKLDLDFSHDSVGWVPECYTDHGYELLGSLAKRAPWSKLHSLSLTIVTETSTLLRFLGSLSATLENLILQDAVLISRSEGGKQDTWSFALPSIAQEVPKLKSLDLFDLVDFATGNSRNAMGLLGVQDSSCHECETRKSAVIRELLKTKKLLNLKQMCQHCNISARNSNGCG